MPIIEDALFCDGCGAEIPGAPVPKGRLAHCCQDCAQGLECDCALFLAEDGGDREAYLGSTTRGGFPAAV